MIKPEVPSNEAERLNELKAYQIIGTPENDDYDFITTMAVQICGTKFSLISLVTEDKQWFLSHQGTKITETSKALSICAHAINESESPFIIEDTRKDQRFFDNPLTIDDPNFIFYAGIPLINSNGYALGTLCVIDDKPNHLTEGQLHQLSKLANQTVKLLELRRSQIELRDKNEQLEHSNELLQETQVANQIGVWELDIATGHTVWSDMVYEIHEVPLDFDHNKDVGIEFYHPDYRAIISEALQDCIKHGHRFDVTCIMIPAKGNQKWVKATGRKVGAKVIGSFQDITRIKEDELKFKGIFNSTFTFIGFLNTEGILLEANDTAVNMAGLKHDDVLGKPFWDCYWWQISEQTQEELKANFLRALSGEEVVYEVAVWIQNQIPITILFSLKPLFDSTGKVIFVIPEGRPVQEIIDSRRRYKSVIEGTNAGTWEWNVQTGTTVFNERWAEILGYTLKELEPHNVNTWIKLTNSDDLKESENRLKQCFNKSSEYYEMEARMQHKAGHWVWVYSRGKVFEWTEDDQPLLMYGTHQDITLRKLKEEALRISEETFRRIFESAAEGMALLEENGKWLKVNARLCEIVGYSEKELLELTFQDLTHPDDLDGDLTLLNELIRGERSNYQMEKRYFHKKGHIVYILLAVSMVRDNEGNVLHLISQIIDITKLKLTEFKLKSLLAENEALMDATSEVAFIATDKNGLIKNINSGTKKIFGYSEKSALGKSILKLLFLENEWQKVLAQSGKESSEETKAEELIHVLANDKKHAYQEWTFKTKKGTLVPILLSVTEIKSDQLTTGFLFAATDISQIKSIQAQLEQKNEQLEQFANIAAHDLKEPLRGITTFMSILQKKYSDQLDDKAKSYIEFASDNALRMKNLISDILDFSRTGDVGQDQINLDELMDLVFKNYQNYGKKSKVILSKTKLPTITGDSTSLIQLFTNLIDNGIKYQSENTIPEVSITAEEDQNSWIFSIADNGIGIEPEYQDKVFEIFKRLHSHSEYSGTGIGLATCKKIVLAYGGKIWFEPNYPNGTIFKISIPKK